MTGIRCRCSSEKKVADTVTTNADRAHQLVLASSSIYRRDLLSRLVPEFMAIAPGVDERAWESRASGPQALAELLAREKALAVLTRYPAADVIGSDQLVDLDGQVLGKPGSVEAAVQQLLAMSGRCHRLLTAVCVVSGRDRHEFVNETRLWMRTLTAAEALRYVQRDQPLDCAGSYRIEGAGIGLFERIETDDFTSIMGLPLMALAAELRRRGYLIP